MWKVGFFVQMIRIQFGKFKWLFHDTDDLEEKIQLPKRIYVYPDNYFKQVLKWVPDWTQVKARCGIMGLLAYWRLALLLSRYDCYEGKEGGEYLKKSKWLDTLSQKVLGCSLVKCSMDFLIASCALGQVEKWVKLSFGVFGLLW